MSVFVRVCVCVCACVCCVLCVWVVCDGWLSSLCVLHVVNASVACARVPFEFVLCVFCVLMIGVTAVCETSSETAYRQQRTPW